MATRLEIVYSIKELMKEHTDDSLMSDKHILFLFDTHRAKFLRQLYSNRAKALDNSAKQQLCLNMETVDRGVCGIDTGCTIRRSKKRIPDLLSLQGRSALISAGPAVVGSKKFEVLNASSVAQIMNDKYASTSVFIDDGYLYMAGYSPAEMLLKCVRIEGVFSNPNELEGFLNCCGCEDTAEACITDETTYPVPGHLLPDLSQAVLKDFLTTLQVSMARDIENDSVPGKAGQTTSRRR